MKTQDTTKKSPYAQIQYCITYSIVTPESAEHGDFDSHGFCDESANRFQMYDNLSSEENKRLGEECTLTADGIRDLISVAESFGIAYHGDADWAHSYGEEVLSYETGETIEYALHVDNPRQWHHIMKALTEKPYKY